MQVAALSKPEESIDEKYEACLKRLGQSKLGFITTNFYRPCFISLEILRTHGVVHADVRAAQP